MDLPIGLPKPLSQPPLIGPTGARLVLGRLDFGYPSKGSAGRGRWFDNIAGTDAKTFLSTVNLQPRGHGENEIEDFTSAVVLVPDEYKLRVGGMSLAELRSQLEKYWGRGSVPGAAADGDYQDVWVPAWQRELGNSQDPYYLSSGVRLDRKLFSHWVNRECAKWLGYFIAKNHTFGVVHAWFAAFLAVIPGCLVCIAKSLTDMESIPNLKFRMSFDLCIKDHEETVNGIPSLPLNTRVTTHNGMQVVQSMINTMFPRRVWDICANTVIPAPWVCGPDCPLLKLPIGYDFGVIPVSHAWAANDDLAFTLAEANQQLWPIPLPRGVQLEDIRGEMIRLGVRYAWLDVLCLRQQAQPALAKELALPVSQEVVEKREQRRLEEWKVDVPTIGAIYSNHDLLGIYRGMPTVIFMSGLGRPFRDEGWTSERHWLRRVWTLQETPALSQCLIAGLPEEASYWGDDGGSNDDDTSGSDFNSGNIWPWNCKVCSVLCSLSFFSACGIYQGEPLECLMRRKGICGIYRYIVCHK